MDTIGAYLDQTAELEKEAFLKKFPHPFLVTVEEQRGGVPKALAPGGDVTQAATVCQSPGMARQATIAARDAKVYVIAKRSGANKENDVTAGRSRDNDIWMDDAEVSKHHVRFRVSGSKIEIFDLNSTNGTFVNEKRLEKGGSLVVRPNDSVRFGRAARTQLLDADAFYEYLSLLRKFVGL